MSQLSEIVTTLTKGRKRKEDSERFKVYEDLKEKRDELMRQWELHLGQVQEVQKPADLDDAEKLHVKKQTREFIHGVNLALADLKPQSTVWLLDEKSKVFARQTVGDVNKAEKSLVVCLSGNRRPMSFFGNDDDFCTEAVLLPNAVGELSPETTLQAYRDLFRTHESKRMFNEA